MVGFAPVPPHRPKPAGASSIGNVKRETITSRGVVDPGPLGGRSMPRRLPSFGPLPVVMALAAHGLAAPPVDFQREVRPILADHCSHCHGADDKTRKGKLRLDTREAALKGGSSGGPAVVPGKP